MVVPMDGDSDSCKVMMMAEKEMIGGDDEVPPHRLLLLQL